MAGPAAAPDLTRIMLEYSEKPAVARPVPQQQRPTCTECGREFAYQRGLVRHQKREHGRGDLAYHCSSCTER